MAQYRERHACGHYTDVRLYGPSKDREAALRLVADATELLRLPDAAVAVEEARSRMTVNARCAREGIDR
jgi:hypothetical protein